MMERKESKDRRLMIEKENNERGSQRRVLVKSDSSWNGREYLSGKAEQVGSYGNTAVLSRSLTDDLAEFCLLPCSIWLKLFNNYG